MDRIKDTKNHSEKETINIDKKIFKVQWDKNYQGLFEFSFFNYSHHNLHILNTYINNS